MFLRYALRMNVAEGADFIVTRAHCTLEGEAATPTF